MPNATLEVIISEMGLINDMCHSMHRTCCSCMLFINCLPASAATTSKKHYPLPGKVNVIPSLHLPLIQNICLPLLVYGAAALIPTLLVV